MTNRFVRSAARLGFILCYLTLSTSVLWAQNENETVGFQSNHAFDSGQFGEDIDILNGNLGLSIPIGPSFAVNQNYSYQLMLRYNSKIWDTTRWANASGVGASRYAYRRAITTGSMPGADVRPVAVTRSGGRRGGADGRCRRSG